jgi:predicted 2-oxoglutarate/Fe(II)-dependent dioxygenase YbiX
MSQKFIYDYGLSIVDKHKNCRRYINIGYVFVLDDFSIDMFINLLSLHLSIDLSIFSYKVVKRTSESGFSMKWHVDDCIVYKTSNSDDKYMLLPKDKNNVPNNVPIFSAVYYLSGPDDFTGGEFEFVDEIISPQQGFVLFFNSNEVHRVLPVKSGIRKSILIKFYRKD